MRFSLRLTLFFTVTLLAIQGATIFAIQTRLRDTLMREGESQMAAAETRFVRQLSDLQDQLAEGVRLLTLDFALRQAVAQRDAATVISVLRNHGNRVGASRMLLIGADGTIEGDTSADPRDALRTFPDPALLDRAADEDRAGRVAVMDGKPVWLVVVPVMAPDLIAFVAAALPLDNAQLARIRDIAGVPGQIGIAVFADGGWRAKAGAIDADVLRQLPEEGMPRTMTGTSGGETIVVTRTLATAPGAPVVTVVLDYPLSDVLHRYQRVSLGLIPILLLGLLGTLAGATAISRGVSRPIEALARQTLRIAAGDYAASPLLRRTDEVGQLSVALDGMTRAIADRERQVRHQATHDPVTGLANRAAVAAAIDAMSSPGVTPGAAPGTGAFDVMSASGSAPGSVPGAGAILAIGLIRWRETTSTVGRDVGDRLLCEAAARIRLRFADNADALAIACIGESTFAVLLAEAYHSTALLAAARVIDAFDVPYREAELAIDAPVAVGISLLPDHGTGAAQLLRRAEVALAVAMNAETRSAVYHPDTDPYRQERLSLMSDLRAGLPRGEFQLLYQPKLDLALGRIAGAEALVRWTHPTRGTVMPDDFIALAEETGNIQHLTRWALRTGLTEAAQWRDRGLLARVAINLSARDLTDEMLPTRVAGLLRETRTPARSLILEITESAIMNEPNTAIAVLRRLDDMGIDLAIDDFGVGQSSLAYLRRLPVREIKLDKAFVLKLAESPDDQAIVRAVTELGHGLGYRVTAEGVESARCLRMLKELGCDYAQGYYVGRPLPTESFMTFVTSKHDSWAAELGRSKPDTDARAASAGAIMAVATSPGEAVP